MRQSLAVRVLIAACFAVPLVAAGNAVAQSFFEKLFGLGDSRPAAAVASTPRPLMVRPAPVFDRDSAREQRSSRPGNDEERSGQTYQTMCVRTCDGYYWPVRYPAARGDFAQDANVCASTCGAQAKLYYRAGPGSEPEEMRDQDGNSYGSTKTAFAYRKGLVNGCACRGMPWSDAERARHEGYALAEAEKAIRLAQAEAEKAAVAAAEADRVAADKTHRQLLAQVAAAEAAHAAAAAAEARGVAQAGPAMGPAEAAAIAGFAQAGDDVAAGGEPEVAVAEPRGKGRKAAGRDRARASRSAEASADRRQRLPRGQQVVARPGKRYAASVQKAPWWAQ